MDGMEPSFSGVENYFKKDQEGRTVFFTPISWGSKTVGYIIPDEEKKNELIKIYNQYTYQVVAIMLIAYYAIRKSFILLLFVFGALFVMHYVHSLRIKKIIQDLQVSDMQLPPRNKREALTLLIIVILAMGAMFTVFGFVFSVQNMGLKGILLYTAVLFAAVLFVMVLIYRYARK